MEEHSRFIEECRLISLGLLGVLDDAIEERGGSRHDIWGSGDDTFSKVSEESNLESPPGTSLGGSPQVLEDVEMTLSEGEIEMQAGFENMLEIEEGVGDVPSVLERLTSFPTALPVSLKSSLLRVAFTMPSQCSPLKFFVAGASQTSVELRSLPRSSPVFSRVLQSLPELLLVRRSSSLSAGVPATSSEPLSLGVLWRFFARLPLSSESFPVVSYDAAIAS